MDPDIRYFCGFRRSQCQLHCGSYWRHAYLSFDGSNHGDWDGCRHQRFRAAEALLTQPRSSGFYIHFDLIYLLLLYPSRQCSV